MEEPEVRILSAGSALPGKPVDNARLARHFKMDKVWEQWVDHFIGTRTRHLARDLDTGEQQASLTDLAADAASVALTAAGIAPAEVDFMVMGTATPDMLMPATVNMVAERLGINDVPTYQLQSGCSGAVQALDVAYHLILTGRYQTALVIGGDTTAKHFDPAMSISSMPPPQLVNLLLFGDGAGALVLRSGGRAGGRAVLHRVFTRLTGLGREPGQTLEWYGLADRHSGRPPAAEEYKAIEESVPVMTAEIMRELLEDLKWEKSDFDFILPPQLSGRMTPAIVDGLGVPGAEEISCVVDTGNTGNALPFIQVEHALTEMAPGDRALGLAVESSKWIKAGFAFERI
ncbi:3-oxoacyl-ACP synthase III family protein [Actinoallomurus soli]|uniref:3-oxoacyl-ACP synthase III family protein n=1 Tax=Actinoallomurus soli TaxID=2952535 RepID=UPI0020939C88|nr:3-oxoacyl-ACP synthase III family protein [Actinoallomurus soli]MCO5974060.1 3-oxoacyl-ACP synthase III family protein [Actinoallomurus soli]